MTINWIAEMGWEPKILVVWDWRWNNVDRAGWGKIHGDGLGTAKIHRDGLVIGTVHYIVSISTYYVSAQWSALELLKIYSFTNY